MDSQQPIGTPAGLPRSAILRGNEPVRTLFQQGKGFRQGAIVIKYHVVELAQGEPPQQQTVLYVFTLTFQAIVMEPALATQDQLNAEHRRHRQQHVLISKLHPITVRTEDSSEEIPLRDWRSTYL